jgi:hypothetical protein
MCGRDIVQMGGQTWGQTPSLFIAWHMVLLCAPIHRTSRGGTATNADKKSRSNHLEKAEGFREQFEFVNVLKAEEKRS